MNTGTIAAGIVLLILGASLYLYASDQAKEYETTLGQIARAFSPEYQEKYELYSYMKIGGGIFALLGFVLILVGLFESPSNEQSSPSILSQEYYKKQILELFPSCPLCHSSESIVPQLTIGGKDFMICKNCGAKWHVYFSPWTGELKWLKLVSPGTNDLGKNLLGQEKPPEFWVKLEREGRSKTQMEEKITHKSDSGEVNDIELKLQKLNALYEKGLLTDDEYKEQKRKILKALLGDSTW